MHCIESTDLKSTIFGLPLHFYTYTYFVYKGNVENIKWKTKQQQKNMLANLSCQKTWLLCCWKIIANMECWSEMLQEVTMFVLHKLLFFCLICVCVCRIWSLLKHDKILFTGLGISQVRFSFFFFSESWAPWNGQLLRVFVPDCMHAMIDSRRNRTQKWSWNGFCWDTTPLVRTNVTLGY